MCGSQFQRQMLVNLCCGVWLMPKRDVIIWSGIGCRILRCSVPVVVAGLAYPILKQSTNKIMVISILPQLKLAVHFNSKWISAVLDNYFRLCSSELFHT